MIQTLSQPRLTKYLAQTRNDEHLALRLYLLNAHLSAAMFTDLHFVEIALRNKFDGQLAAKFGATWFNDATFRGLLRGRTLQILDDAITEASKNLAPGQQLLPGKVVSELSFGFWHNLTNKYNFHSLWIPCFGALFGSKTQAKRLDIHTKFETLRHLRNRIAHHEPIYHMDLEYRRNLMIDLATQLCPTTAMVLRSTSTVKTQLKTLKVFCRRKRI